FVWKQNYILVDEYFFFCCTWIVNSARKNKSGQDSVPLLGDIPWFGQLFRHDGKEDERRELVVFITPRLVSSE
ncbi:hypothetical protein RSW25_20955, partial [Escherichia coli]|nr:hypothetical protein [Escherichia coli]